MCQILKQSYQHKARIYVSENLAPKIKRFEISNPYRHLHLLIIRLEHHLEEYPSGEIPCHRHLELFFTPVSRDQSIYC